jgi:hypothetical protein
VLSVPADSINGLCIPFSIAVPNVLVVVAFDLRLTIESCVGPTCVTLARRLGATCPLADPDTVANMSFGIDRAAGSSVSYPGVVSVVLHPHVAGNKME